MLCSPLGKLINFFLNGSGFLNKFSIPYCVCFKFFAIPSSTLGKTPPVPASFNWSCLTNKFARANASAPSVALGDNK